MNDKKIKKINFLYLIGYIVFPILICTLCYLLSAVYFPKGTMAVILIMVPTLLSILWWILGGSIIYKINKKKFERELEESGFERNHTFYGKGSTVTIDVKRGEIGLLFFWNPFEKFVIHASRISKAWVNDGKSGHGFMEGSMRVSFLFIVDDIKVRVDTFTSNQRFRMDSDYILTGISKADMMVEIINQARVSAHKNEK